MQFFFLSRALSSLHTYIHVVAYAVALQFISIPALSHIAISDVTFWGFPSVKFWASPFIRLISALLFLLLGHFFSVNRDLSLSLYLRLFHLPDVDLR